MAPRLRTTAIELADDRFQWMMKDDEDIFIHLSETTKIQENSSIQSGHQSKNFIFGHSKKLKIVHVNKI